MSKKKQGERDECAGGKRILRGSKGFDKLLHHQGWRADGSASAGSAARQEQISSEQ